MRRRYRYARQTRVIWRQWFLGVWWWHNRDTGDLSLGLHLGPLSVHWTRVGSSG